MREEGPGALDALGRTRAERGRQRRDLMERRRRRDAERDAYLRSQLEPGEAVVALGYQGLVTDRRVLFAWLLNWPPRVGEWIHDAVAFGEITRWTLGRRHDHRPLLRLEHPSHLRIEWVPAHRFLWFRSGNAEAEVSHEETTLYFGRDRDPLFAAILGRLQLTNVQQGEPFLVSLPGTREERTRGSRGVLYVRGGPFRRLTRLRGVAFRLEDRLYRGRVAWQVRLVSWFIFALPAWLISPWLVLPAIALAEAGWIAGLQWSSHRDRYRRFAPR